MSDLLIATAPVLLLALVLLAGFLGTGSFGTSPAQTFDTLATSFSGLVAYWTLKESVGATIATDSRGVDSGHPNGANPGTYTALPAAVGYNAGLKSAAVPGTFSLGAQRLTSNGGGTTVDFEGGFVEVPFNAALNPPQFSLAVGVSPDWMANPAQPAIRVVIESGEAEGAGTGFVLRSNASDQWEAAVGNGTANGVVVTGPHVTARNAVNFLVVTFDGATLSLFVDISTNVTTAPVAPAYKPAISSDLRIGSGSAKATGAGAARAQNPFQGRIGSVALFNRALATAEIDQLAHGFLTS